MSVASDFQLLAAQANDQMVVYYPEHRTVRVVWKRVSLRLKVDEFRSLMVVFEQCRRGLVDANDGVIRLAQHDAGCFELMIEEATVRLFPMDYWLLGQLLEVAWHRLIQQKGRDMSAYPFDHRLHLN